MPPTVEAGLPSTRNNARIEGRTENQIHEEAEPHGVDESLCDIAERAVAEPSRCRPRSAAKHCPRDQPASAATREPKVPGGTEPAQRRRSGENPPSAAAPPRPPPKARALSRTARARSRRPLPNERSGRRRRKQEWRRLPRQCCPWRRRQFASESRAWRPSEHRSSWQLTPTPMSAMDGQVTRPLISRKRRQRMLGRIEITAAEASRLRRREKLRSVSFGVAPLSRAENLAHVDRDRAAEPPAMGVHMAAGPFNQPRDRREK